MRTLLKMVRTGHDSLRKRELRLARVSMIIVLIFMVCHSPKIIPSVCEIAHGDAKVTDELYTMNAIFINYTYMFLYFQFVPFFIEVSHLMLTINCSLNFPTYFVASGASLRVEISWDIGCNTERGLTLHPRV